MRINTEEPIVIRPPKFSFKAFMAWLIVTGFVAFMGINLIFWAAHQHKWANTPPKVITKVVHENGLTSAQNAFIQQCESQVYQYTNDGNDISNHGIPNVTVNPWTCSFAK